MIFNKEQYEYRTVGDLKLEPQEDRAKTIIIDGGEEAFVRYVHDINVGHKNWMLPKAFEVTE